MSIFAHDNFESYPLGTLLSELVGYDKNGFGDGIIVAGGWNGSSKALQLDQGVGIGTTLGGPVPGISFAAYLWGGPSFQFEQSSIFEGHNFKSGAGSRILELASVEADGTISLYAGDGVLLCNTAAPGQGTGATYVSNGLPPFFLSAQEWIYVQISLSFGTWFDGMGTARLQVGGIISINERLYCQGGRNTPIGIADLPLGVPNCNQWNSEGINGNANKMDNLYVSDSGGYGEPADPTTISILSSQNVVEMARSRFDPYVIVSQAAVETSSHPETFFIRTSQLVVEVMGKSASGGQVFDGMKVREI